MEFRRITLSHGHPTSGPGWVYVWCWHGRVRYVGATWLDPHVRTESHLHGDTDDARSLALRAATAADPNPTILALPVPAGADRSAYRAELTRACASAGVLAENYIGPRAPAPAAGAMDAAWLSEAVAAVLDADPA